MAKFETVSKYANAGLSLPKRGTAQAAGYDFYVAEDTVIPSYFSHKSILSISADKGIWPLNGLDLEQVEYLTKSCDARPTLVPTGIKCKLDEGTYLELSVRSSTPLKYWLILANGVGIIDADYYNNNSNEGHIYFQIINLSPFSIVLKKGDRIGQGIIKRYEITEDDEAGGVRQGGFGSTNE